MNTVLPFSSRACLSATAIRDCRGFERNLGVMVRPASRFEVESVVSLWKEFMNDPSAIDEPIPTHEENRAKQVQFVEELIKEDPNQVLVAQDGNELIGYMLYRKEQKTALELKHRMSYIYDLYVKPDHRGKGVGRNLLQTCLDDLHAAGPRQIRLNVWTKNDRAIRLYGEMGFRDHLMVLKMDVNSESSKTA
jgi:GNAT superfamily N-acetyltransferase